MPVPRYVAIANPDSLRWRAYERDLLAFWRGRGVEPDVTVVPWATVVERDGNLDELPAFDRPALVRLESPGRDWLVTRLLLAAGGRERPGEDDLSTLEYRKGRLVRPGLYHLGFCRVLRGLRRSFDARPHLTPTACPLEVGHLFDKNATSARLAAAGIPVPPSLPPPATPAALIEQVRARRFATAYVKLNTGSSASAIAVLHTACPAPWALSTMRRIDDEYYSTRRLVPYEGEALQALLAFLLRESACVQQRIAMARLDEQNFDVRVVVIHGRPAFTIFRLADGPMTNLHLGGRRGDTARCRAAIPTRAWLDGLDHCVEAARLYRAAMVGIDLLFERGYLRHFLLEINAFGDFFPHLTDDAGRSVHQVEIESTARACGMIDR